MTEKRYLDSSLDQGDSLRNRSIAEFKGLESIEPDKGERQTPGRGGFRLADTPQAWIFIQKKEWLDDTWTYVVDTPFVSVNGQQVDIDKISDQLTDKRAELTRERSFTGPFLSAQAEQHEAKQKQLQADIESLQQTLTAAKAELAKRGGQSQFDGKVTQIDVRTALGNIITRKLDWMNDHEKFAKRANLTQTQFEQIQLGKDRKNLADSLIRIEEEQSRIADNIQLLENQNTDLEAATESLDRLIAQAETIENPTPEEEGALNTLIQQRTVAVNRQSRNETRIAQLTARQTEVAGIASLSGGESDPVVDSDTALIYAPVTLSGNAFTRYYKSPVFRSAYAAEAKTLRDELASTLTQLEAEAKSLVNRTRVAGQAEQLLLKQAEYVDTKRQYDSLNTRLKLRQKDSLIKLETGNSVFNGVIELANVSSVQTTVSLEGEGSASFTIENPQNIFFISRDDIDLALTEDPFLNNARTGVDGLLYYRGHFYPEHIVRMLQNRNGASIEVGRSTGLSQSRAEILSNQIVPEITAQIEEKRQQAAIQAEVGSYDLASALHQEASTLEADLIVLKEELRGLSANSLQQAVDEQALKDKNRQTQETTEKEKEMNLIRQTLLKYYASKAVFQVLDRVYIWMTSPTRTLYRLNRTGDDRYAIEDPSAIGVMQQLAAVQQSVDSIAVEIQRARDFINDHTPQDFVGGLLSEEDRVLDSDPGVLFEVGDGFNRFAGHRVTLLAPDVVKYLNELLNEQKQRQGILSFLKKQVKSTDSVSAASTFNKIPTAPAQGLLSEEQKQVIGEYESRFLGLEEDRVQVFQGVISTVKQTYSNGKYQIQISCKDNMIFLNMSRIMIKPALRNSGQSPQGILQDPIWRNNELAGNWKNGIVVLDFAFVNDEVGAKLDKNIGLNTDEQANLLNKKVASESEGRRVSPFVTSLPFARIDAANLVSFIITGFPYNFEQFIKNASFGGRLSLDRKSGTTDQRSEDSSFFAFLKRQIGEANDRLGDFEPFIDITTTLKNLDGLKKRQEALEKKEQQAVEDLKTTYEVYLLNRLERYLRRVNDSKANSSILNTSRVGAVEKQLALKAYGQAREDFRNKATKAAAQLQRALTGSEEETPELLTDFSRAIIASAQKNVVKDEAAERVARVGQVAGNETDIQAIVKKLNGAQPSDFGPFAVIATFIKETASTVKKASTTGGVNRGIDVAGNTSADATSKAVDNALTAFVKELLMVQPDFSQAYLNVSLASTNLASFNTVRPQLQELLGEINAEAASVAKDFEEGPQSTIEKIVRQEKKNFLIISDQYTLDDSIQAYHTEIAGGNFALFQSEFETAISVCRRAADQVDFEFYADENGNLQFKPPSYNRILKEHFNLISETDSTVRDAVLIRFGGDDGAVFRSVLKGLALMSQVRTEFSSKRLLARQDLEKSVAAVKRARTVTERQKITGISTQDALKDSASLGKSLESRTRQAIGSNSQEVIERDKVQQLLAGTGNADLGTIVSITASINAEEEARETARLLRTQEDKALIQINLDEKLRRETLGPLSEDLADLKQQRADVAALPPAESDPQILAILDQQITAAQQVVNQKEVEIKRDTNRQKADLYTRLIEKVDALLTVAEKARDRARTNTETFVNSLPTFTDETRIHRIADHDLISYDMTEAPPRFTHLEITGSPELVRITPAEFYWAGGVDYDNWRQYGFMSESMQKAYFHSGDTARVYLRAMLGRERGRVLSASAQVRGDAKYRVGDCVFIESLGMYFYITSTNHSLSYGQSYTTNLTLEYGRRIGELIPHPFDALGKIMIETYQSDVELLLAREQFLGLEKEQQLRS